MRWESAALFFQLNWKIKTSPKMLDIFEVTKKLLLSETETDAHKLFLTDVKLFLRTLASRYKTLYARKKVNILF